MNAWGQAVLSDEPFWKWETDKIQPGEFAQRRNQLRTSLEPRTALVVVTNPEQTRNNDVPFQFRPASNFWYLTGCEEPESATIITSDPFSFGDKSSLNEAIFVMDRDAGAETWTGYRLGPARAAKILGYQASFSQRQFSDCVKKLVDSGFKILQAPAIPESPYIPQLVALGKFALWSTPINEMRYVKSPAEIAIMKKAAAISAQGHIEAMRSCEPGMREYDLQAMVEYMFKKGGCEYPAYGSIVGCGPNSTVLHYEWDRRELKDGEIICMDTAGEFHGYAADVTRSYPVNGKFTPAQKTIYELVLKAQDAGIAECRAGKPFGAAHQAAYKVITDGLTELGIISKPNEVGRYFMHGTSHTVGLDVHDTYARGRNLEPGVVMTVEPGIYIKADSPCDKKWWNIGVRIEDDILVTKDAPVNMSAAAPRTVAQIEALMKEKGIGNVISKPFKAK